MPLQAPPQPAKRRPRPDFAVSVTIVSLAKPAVQLSAQSVTPAGDDVTVPAPLTVTVSFSCTSVVVVAIASAGVGSATSPATLASLSIIPVVVVVAVTVIVASSPLASGPRSQVTTPPVCRQL